MGPESAAPSRIFIVSRRHPELYEHLKSRLADDSTVSVVLDRRLGARRRRALPAAAERRRRGERRVRHDVDAQLAASSLAIVAAGTRAPASEARQWVDAMQRGLQAVRAALDEHERLAREAPALRLENERLRAEIELVSKELAELDATVTRALELATDLHTRLHKPPEREVPG